MINSGGISDYQHAILIMQIQDLIRRGLGCADPPHLPGG
ncbi:hypothetical protein LINGRAHAP2_LOCUS13077 [Linum grandiflorum]